MASTPGSGRQRCWLVSAEFSSGGLVGWFVTLMFLSPIENGKYKFENVLPGLYEVTVPDVYLCWASTAHKLNVKNVEETVPVFTHNGYSVSVISSHATQVGTLKLWKL